MLPTESADLIIVVAMFALRLGVPVAITLALGYWLEKRLQPNAQETPDTRRRLQWDRGSNATRFMPPHCWVLRQDEAARGAEDAASQRPDLPCWLALQVEGYKFRPECFMCARYTSRANAA